MKNTIFGITLIFMFSCASTSENKIAEELPRYSAIQKSESELIISGKYLNCQMTDSSNRGFHLGQGKVHSVNSNFGKRNRPGEQLYAFRDEMILISESAQEIQIGSSVGSCEIPLLGVREIIYKISRQALTISETKNVASDKTYGSNNGLATSKEIGECKRYSSETLYGSCEVLEVNPDVVTFLKPFKPKEL